MIVPNTPRSWFVSRLKCGTVGDTFQILSLLIFSSLAYQWRYMVYPGSRLTLELLCFAEKNNRIRKISCSDNSDWSSASLSEALESEGGISERLVVQLIIGSSQSRLKDTKNPRKTGQERRVANYIRSHIWKSNTANTADWAELHRLSE